MSSIRKFDLLANDGSTIAWSLSIEQVAEVLQKLYEDSYKLMDKETKVIAYILKEGWNTGLKVIDPVSSRSVLFKDLVGYENYYYTLDRSGRCSEEIRYL